MNISHIVLKGKKNTVSKAKVDFFCDLDAANNSLSTFVLKGSITTLFFSMYIQNLFGPFIVKCDGRLHVMVISP